MVRLRFSVVLVVESMDPQGRVVRLPLLVGVLQHQGERLVIIFQGLLWLEDFISAVTVALGAAQVTPAVVVDTMVGVAQTTLGQVEDRLLLALGQPRRVPRRGQDRLPLIILTLAILLGSEMAGLLAVSVGMVG